MSRAIVFFEHYLRAGNIQALVRLAQEKGYVPVVVCNSGVDVAGLNGFLEVVRLDEWDTSTLRSVCLELSSRYEIGALLSELGLFTPWGPLSAQVSELAKEMGLVHSSSEAFYRTNNKFLMRDALAERGVESVPFALASSEDEFLLALKSMSFPLILKPVTGAGSTLVFKCRTEEDALEKFRYIQEKLSTSHYGKIFCQYHYSYTTLDGTEYKFESDRTVLIEQYLPGKEVSVECVATEEGTIALLLHDKVLMSESHAKFLEHCLITPTPRFSEEEIETFKAHACKAVDALGITNCMIHVEMKISDEMKPAIIEVNPRLGGGLIARSLMTMCDFNPYEALLEMRLGSFTPKASYPSRDKMHSMFWIFPEKGGLLEAVEGIDEVRELPGVIDVELKEEIGSQIPGTDEECFLVEGWMQVDSMDQAISNYKKVTETIKLEIS